MHILTLNLNPLFWSARTHPDPFYFYIVSVIKVTGPGTVAITTLERNEVAKKIKENKKVNPHLTAGGLCHCSHFYLHSFVSIILINDANKPF